jgi:hypothetical protein
MEHESINGSFQHQPLACCVCYSKTNDKNEEKFFMFFKGEILSSTSGAGSRGMGRNSDPFDHIGIHGNRGSVPDEWGRLFLQRNGSDNHDGIGGAASAI